MKNSILALILLLTSISAYSQSDKKPIDSLLTNGRCLPSPLTSLPFPFSDWCGGPVIGEPASVPDYLTQAIEKATKKTDTKWTASGIKIYGWLDAAVNGST